MKKLLVAGFAALLQVNAGAAILGRPEIDSACSFAKSVDMSADSSLCAKESVDARGYAGRARATTVGLMKEDVRHDSTSSTSPRPPLFTQLEKEQAKGAIPIFAAVGKGVVGTFLVLLGASGVTTAVLPAVITLVGVALIIDGVVLAATGKDLAMRVYESYVR